MYAAVHWSSKGIVTARLPFLPSPILLRRGTADAEVFDQIFLQRQYDLRIHPQWAQLHKKYQGINTRSRTPLIVDCGANIGLSTLFFVHLFPGAKVIAIEPDPGNFEMLQRNLGSYANVVPLRGAISDLKGWATITNPSARSWAFQVAESSPEQAGTVPTFTMEDVCNLVIDYEMLLVKIDIEGGEQQLFRSNLDWLAKVPLIIIELHDWMLPWSGSSRNFFKALQDLQFDFVVAGENALFFNWESCQEAA